MAGKGNSPRKVVNVKSIFPPTNSDVEGVFDDVSYMKSKTNTVPVNANAIQYTEGSDTSTLLEEKVGVMVFHSDTSDSDYEVRTRDRVTFHKSLPRTDLGNIRLSNTNGHVVHDQVQEKVHTDLHNNAKVHARVKTHPLITRDNRSTPMMTSYTPRSHDEEINSVSHSDQHTSPRPILKRNAYKPQKGKAPEAPQVPHYNNNNYRYSSANTPVEVRKKRRAPPAPIPSEESAPYAYMPYQRDGRANSYSSNNTRESMHTYNQNDRLVNAWKPTRQESAHTESKANRKSKGYARSEYSQATVGSTLRQRFSNLFGKKAEKQRTPINPVSIRGKTLHNFTFVDSKIFNPEESQLHHKSGNSTQNECIFTQPNRQYVAGKTRKQIRPTWWDMKTMNTVKSDVHSDVFLGRPREPQPDYN